MLEALKVRRGTPMIPGLDSCSLRVVTAPTLPASQEEVKCTGKEPDGIDGKNSTPLQGLIFSKSRVRGYGRLGNG